MAQLKLYHFTQNQLSDRLLGDIKNFIESEIQEPFIWDPKNNTYNIMICVTKENSNTVGVGVAKQPGVLEYLCVHEKYANQDIGLKILGHLVKIYSYLKMSATSDLHHYFSHFNVSYEEEYLILTSKQRDYTNPSIEYKDVKFSTR
jgi:hypothetical protein